uniref:ATP-dependent DNA helicase n=1 Tax=Meloidogyne enterolobii TaxID=390850 RepID=A0A6V7X4F6_MELEN|nr:unnamed protein product [Meloidogyne enterolobii]
MKQIDDIDLDIEEKFDIVEELDIGRRSYELLNDEQRAIVDEFMNRISNPDGKVAFYFLSGPGGSGTTFVISKIVHLIRGMKKKVSTMAFTGIAATLLPGGRTMNNRFGLNLDMSNSKIGPSSKAWTELENIDMFICDEAPMIHKRALSTIDLKLKEIMKSNIDFGGKIMLMAGDFRQTLPIQKHATRAEICDLTVKRSRFWKSAKKYRLSKNMRALDSEKHFAKELLDIGSGIWNNEQDEVVLPIDCISKGDLVDEIFGYVIADKNWNEMANMAIVAPKNVDVKELNNRVLNMLPEDKILYTSIDKAENEDKASVR